MIKFAICKLKVVEGKENDCQKETTASKKNPPAVFDFIDEQL